MNNFISDAITMYLVGWGFYFGVMAILWIIGGFCQAARKISNRK